MAANSEKAAPRRGKGKPFEKGKSGNPNGRPKQTKEQADALAAIRALAPNAAEELGKMLTDPKLPAAVKMRAIEIILERTYGKAPQTVDMGIKLSSEAKAELDAFLAENKVEI